MGATKSNTSTVFRLVFSIVGLYSSFLLWGYLQERLSSTSYDEKDENSNWTYVVVLNLCMALACSIVSLPFLLMQKSFDMDVVKPRSGLSPSALSNCLASPFGYFSLNYINYPLLLLAKSSKLVPVMLLSYIINKKRYSFVQVMSVAMISGGVALFSCKVNPKTMFASNDKSAPTDHSELYKTLIGLALVLINLLLDGFTNARQDKFKKENPSTGSFQMMYQMNIWQIIMLSTYLLLEAVLARNGGTTTSQIDEALSFAVKYPAVVKDIVLFSLSGAVGQVFIFYIITEFGSLTCVLITVTRKFFSILLSVVLFGHTVKSWQWVGCCMVFVGLLTNSMDKLKSQKSKAKKD